MGVKKGESGTDGRSDRIVGELQMSQTRVLESLPYAVIHA